MFEFLLLYPKLIVLPRRALKKITEKPQSLEALIVFLFTLSIARLLTSNAMQDESMRRLAALIPVMSTIYGQILLTWGVGLLIVVIETVLLSIFCQLFDGKGDLRALWTAILSILTITSLINLLPIPHISWIISLWNFVLLVITVMAVYGFRWGKAVGILIIQYAATIVSLLALATALPRLIARH